jgi:hypothetical protein
LGWTMALASTSDKHYFPAHFEVPLVPRSDIFPLFDGTNQACSKSGIMPRVMCQEYKLTADI